ALWLGQMGAVRARRGDVRGAAETLDEACARLESLHNKTFRAAMDLLRGHVDLALARQAQRVGNDDEGNRHVAAARARVVRFRSEDADGERPGRSVVEICLAAASVERALRGQSGAGGWIVDANGRWFRPPGGTRVSLQRRAALGRLLAKLVEHR